MSAPDVNVEKQTKRHRPALLGMAIAAGTIGLIVIAAGMLDVENDAAADLAPAQINAID